MKELIKKQVEETEKYLGNVVSKRKEIYKEIIDYFNLVEEDIERNKSGEINYLDIGDNKAFYIKLNGIQVIYSISRDENDKRVIGRSLFQLGRSQNFEPFMELLEEVKSSKQ